MKPSELTQMQLDLLVDEELTETQRRDLLLRIEREPELWRTLSIRFLERQVEKRAARDAFRALTSAPTLAPVVVNAQSPAAHADVLNPGQGKNPSFWATRSGAWAIAAGLLIAVASATVTWYSTTSPNLNSTEVPSVITAQLPGEVIGMDNSLPVEVPVSKAAGNTISSAMFLDSDAEDTGSPTRQSLIIQPDGKGGAVVVPVTTLTAVTWQ